VLAKLSRQVLAVPDAQERSVAQTRSFSNMALALLYLIHREIPSGLPAGLQAAGQQLLSRYRPVARKTGGDPAIQKFIFLGSGPLYGLASEVMLKMKEMSLAYSEAYHFLEFRHGPISVIDGNTLVAALVDGDTPEMMLNVIRDVRALGARVLALSENPLPDPAGMIDFPVVFQSGLPAPWYAPLFLPILQQMAFERAMASGQNPDQPANLRAVVEAI
jgi:glucosamine--fructose-6-phosphate aminotransferase (isomerizing)